MSSYDIIRRLKKLQKFNKIGYIGTLDRNASGVLPVAINEGVKLIPYLEDGEKVYEAKFLLGITTDTLDIEGKVITEVVPDIYEESYLKEMLSPYKGKITQQIPLFSSKKVNRKPLYKYAREGAPVAPQTKEVEIFNITLTKYEHPYIDLEVSCSKGTYIRALAQDFGSRLGCGATLHSLRRTRHGEFLENRSVDIEYFKFPQDLLNYLTPLEEVMQSMKGVVIEPVLERFLRQGMPIPLLGGVRDWKNGDITRIITKKGTLIGVGTVDLTSKTIKVKRLINN